MSLTIDDLSSPANNFQVLVFTGEGKGKTTAALGLAVAEALKGEKVYIVQFLKGGGYTGELFAAVYLKEHLTIRQFGYGCPKKEEIKSGKAVCDKCGVCFRENKNPVNNYAQAAFDFAKEILETETPGLVVLDEISHALKHKLISQKAVINLIESVKPHLPQTKLVLTGRSMPPEITVLASQATECFPLKHPLTQGIDARRGIEY